MGQTVDPGKAALAVRLCDLCLVTLWGDVAEVIEGNGRTVPLASTGDGVTFRAKGGSTYQVSSANSILQQKEHREGK